MFYFQIYPFVPYGQIVLDKLIKTHNTDLLKSSLGSQTGLHMKKRKGLIVIVCFCFNSKHGKNDSGLFCVVSNAAELMW